MGKGRGRSPGRKRVLVHLELERTHLIATNLTFLTFFRHIFSHIHFHRLPVVLYIRLMYIFAPVTRLKRL